MSGGPVLAGSFPSLEGLKGAIQELQALGVASHQIEVRTPFPVEPEELGLEQKAPRVLRWALIGGLLGGGGAYMLARLAQTLYPLPTGGMELVAGPPTALVTYEGTALGAILLTVLGVLVEGRVFSKKHQAMFAEQAAAGESQLLLFGVDGEALPKARQVLDQTASLAWGRSDEVDGSDSP